jgi:hypothetical protein
MKVYIEKKGTREKSVGLWLEEHGDEVAVIGRDANGGRYSLCRFTCDGTLYRYQNVSSSSGLHVDADGRIALNE